MAITENSHPLALTIMANYVRLWQEQPNYGPQASYGLWTSPWTGQLAPLAGSPWLHSFAGISYRHAEASNDFYHAGPPLGWFQTFKGPPGQKVRIFLVYGELVLRKNNQA